MEINKISNLMASIKKDIENQGIAKRDDIGTVAISAESLTPELAQNAKDSLGVLLDIVDNSIETVTASSENMEDYDLTTAQISAAKLVAGLAMNPTAARNNLGSLTPVSAQNAGSPVTGEQLGIEDMVDTETLSTEAFDGQTINSAVYFSVAYNLLASKQDEFGETFFPTVTIDPTASGASVEARVINLYDQFNRSVSGKAEKGKFNKKSIIKAITDPTILSVDKNLCIPVLRDDSKDLLAEELSSVNKEKGEAITTAPILFGKEVSLLGMSQTDAQLSKGEMDNTDTLDRRVQVQDVFFNLSGRNANDDADITETFKINIASLPHSNFTYSTQDHNKDLSMSFENDSIVINTGSSKLWNGAGSEILAGLPANYNVRLKIVIHGNGNTEFGDISVYQSKFELFEVMDAAGNILEESDAIYTQIKAVIDTIAARAYSVEAYTTNSNIRQRGQLVGVDIHNQIYTVPVRSGVTVLKPVTNSNDADNDATYLASQVTLAGIKMSLEAINTLVGFADTLRNLTNKGTVTDIGIKGVSRFFVDAYYSEINIDVANTVDSKRSGERAEDIKEALVSRLRDEVVKMHTASNYGVAKEVVNGKSNAKTKVAIGTDANIAQYLTNGSNKIDLGAGFEAVVVTTQNPLVAGKAYVTFVDGSPFKNEKVNPLGFGCTFWSPELSVDIVSNRGGANVRELSNMPRFLHVAQLPILSVFTISGLKESLGKVTTNFKNV